MESGSAGKSAGVRVVRPPFGVGSLRKVSVGGSGGLGANEIAPIRGVRFESCAFRSVSRMIAGGVMGNISVFETEDSGFETWPANR